MDDKSGRDQGWPQAITAALEIQAARQSVPAPTMPAADREAQLLAAFASGLKAHLRAGESINGVAFRPDAYDSYVDFDELDAAIDAFAAGFDGSSAAIDLVGRYQLDLQFHGPRNEHRPWRAYQGINCELAGDLLEGWGRTPSEAIDAFVAEFQKPKAC